jgi:hypothetical protein
VDVQRQRLDGSPDGTEVKSIEIETTQLATAEEHSEAPKTEMKIILVKPIAG